DIVVPMDDVSQVHADADLNRPLGGSSGVPLAQGLLDLDRAASRFQSTGELDQESIAERLDLPAAVAAENRAQQSIVLVKQFEGLGLVPLVNGDGAADVGEHDRGEPALFGLGHCLLQAPRSFTGERAEGAETRQPFPEGSAPMPVAERPLAPRTGSSS